MSILLKSGFVGQDFTKPMWHCRIQDNVENYVAHELMCNTYK